MKGINESPLKNKEAFIYEKEKTLLASKSKPQMIFQTTNRVIYLFTNLI